MKITVFSDVHGNLPALEVLLKAEKDSDQFVFLGDAVNYAPWSNECVQRIAELPNIIKIRGNHEDSFLIGTYPGSNPVARAFFEFCYPHFAEQKEISSYIDCVQLFDFQFIHTILNKNIYPDTELDLQGNYFIGHSHHQFFTPSNDFKLYNAGSVGQNRKFINRVSYLNWYPEKQEILFKNLLHDIDFVINEMKNRHYPALCLDYYLSKERYT